MKISAIILAKDEEKRIDKCLDSIFWTQEQLVIDNGSTDKTVSKAKQKGARVIETTVASFAARRNIGLKEAKFDWVLYIDSDEIVTPQLKNEIQSLPNHEPSGIVAYRLRRKNYYLGRLWPSEEKILRLFQKNEITRWFGDLHESPEVVGQAGELSGFLLHDTHRNLEEMIAKTNEWSEVEAKLRFEAKHPLVVWWRFIRVMITAFTDSFIAQGGWKAGTTGCIESMYQAFSMFLTYAKLWERQQTGYK